MRKHRFLNRIRKFNLPTILFHLMPSRMRTLNLLAFLLLLVPLFVRSTRYMHFFVLLCIWIILTDSINFVIGIAGQLSLGHAAFVTIGAYAGAILIRDHAWSFWTAMPMGGIITVVAGLILGFMAIRLRGDYLGMVTLGFGEIIRIFSINLLEVTNGPAGFSNIPRPVIFGYRIETQVGYYLMAVLLVFVFHIAFERILFSRFGRACLAIRDDEVAAAAMGVKASNYKILAFCLSVAVAGFVGVFYAAWTTVVTTSSFTLNDSIMLNVMNTLGGIGSLEGAFPGATIIAAIPEMLRPFTTGVGVASLRFTFMGLLLIGLMILRPQGFYGMSIARGYIDLRPLKRFFFPNTKQESVVDDFLVNKSAVDEKLLKEVRNS